MVVAKLDRAWRSVADCLRTLDMLDDRKATLHLIDLGGNSVDTRSPIGRLLVTVLGAVAEMERSQIRQRTRDALRASPKVLGRIPYGYRALSDRTALEPDPDAYPCLLLIHSLRRDGLSSRAIAAEMTRRAIPTPTGRQGWDRRTISRLLQSPVR